MGSVFNKGTKSKPRWFAKVKVDGVWKMVPTGKPTKPLAFKWLEEQEERAASGQGFQDPRKAPTFGDLQGKWLDALTNRSADDDRSRAKKHLLPVFKDKRLREITTAAVMEWIDAQRASRTIKDPTIRHNLNLLSRFFAWAIERGHATTNPVRQIPQGKRPRQSPRTDMPWLADDAVVRTLISNLPEPINLMFYLGNQSGLRTGEIAGLRMSDFSFLDDGIVRARFSYDGPLKEDKNGDGKVKWVPAPLDCAAFLGDWLEARKTSGAGPEDYVFPCAGRDGGHFRKEFIEQCWEETCEALKKNQGSEKLAIELTWYQATRHSFVSRNLSGGATLDEVSAAVGHSSPVVTRRYYDHFIRKTFSPTVRKGLGLGGGDGKAKVLPLKHGDS